MLENKTVALLPVCDKHQEKSWCGSCDMTLSVVKHCILFKESFMIS